MAKEQHFNAADMWFVGEDKQLQFTILDEAGAAVNITGWSINFAVATSPGAAALVSKSTASGIALTTPASGILTVTIADTDTDAIASGRYVYALKRMDNNTETVLAFGDVLLQGSAIQ